MPIYLLTLVGYRYLAWRKLLVFPSLLAAAILVTAPASAAPLTLTQALQSPDHVLLMRHADAPGIGDPSGYVLGNCLTQRNLGERGKRQAKQLGEWLRAQGVHSAKIFSSQWCRCMDTAAGLNFGPVVVEQSLGSFFNDSGNATNQTRQLAQFIAKTLPSKQGHALILVTHQVNIQEYTGENVGSGDMILVKVDRQGKPLTIGRYSAPFSE